MADAFAAAARLNQALEHMAPGAIGCLVTPDDLAAVLAELEVLRLRCEAKDHAIEAAKRVIVDLSSRRVQK